MAIFAYQALDAAKKSVRGTISADHPRHARDQLRLRGLTIQAIDAAHERRRGPSFRLPRRHGHRVTAAVRELATLLGVGIPLTEAIATLARKQRGAFQTALLLL